MKYKRRKTKVSKYISESEPKNQKKRLPKLFLLILFVPLVLSLASSYIIPNFSGISNTFDAIGAMSDDVADYLSDKMSFISKLGKKGAEFCFDYVRKEEKDTALAISTINTTEKQTDFPDDEPIAGSSGDETPQPTDIFSPILPCVGEISSPFGGRVHPLSGETTNHNGIDIAVVAGTEVCAIENGTVEKSEYNQFSGNFIIIRHIDGYTSSYAHLEESNVKSGDLVKKGDVIGTSGQTGAVTGPHLHMEIRKDTVPIDPMSVIE